MKLYREHIVLIAGSVFAALIGLYFWINNSQSQKATVDHVTPQPILIGDQTIAQKRQELLPPDQTPQQLPQNAIDKLKRKDKNYGQIPTTPKLRTPNQ